MARNLLVALLLAATLGGGALALSGCGADEVARVDAAEAAEATRERGTARMTMRMRMTGAGLPQPVTINADGVTHLTEPRARLRFDVAQVLSSFGAPPASESDVEMLLDGADLHVRVPQVEGLRLPGGKSWVALDLRALAEALGFPTEGMDELFNIDPASQLEVLKRTKGLKDLGEEDVDGVPTRHYKGSYRMSDVVAALPARERAQAQRALDALKRLDPGGDAGLDEPTDVEMWVDDDALTRRMRATGKLPAQAGAPAGAIAMDFRLRDFGAELDTSRPPAAETYDATPALSDLLEQSIR